MGWPEACVGLWKKCAAVNSCHVHHDCARYMFRPHLPLIHSCTHIYTPLNTLTHTHAHTQTHTQTDTKHTQAHTHFLTCRLSCNLLFVEVFGSSYKPKFCGLDALNTMCAHSQPVKLLSAGVANSARKQRMLN